MNTLLANRGVLDAMAAGEDPRHIAEGWQPALAGFARKRQMALLYAP
jgi:hypothetical protein